MSDPLEHGPAIDAATIRGLTLFQPWASLAALGHKGTETRPKRTAWRMYLAIHAAKTLPDHVLELCRRPGRFRDALEALGLADVERLPRSVILAVTTLDQCVRSGEVEVDLSVPSREILFGNYAAGRYGLHLGTIEPLRDPLRARGYQGFWYLEPRQVDELRRRIRRIPRRRRPMR